jgi:hypothetical protein
MKTIEEIKEDMKKGIPTPPASHIDDCVSVGQLLFFGNAKPILLSEKEFLIYMGEEVEVELPIIYMYDSNQEFLVNKITERLNAKVYTNSFGKHFVLTEYNNNMDPFLVPLPEAEVTMDDAIKYAIRNRCFELSFEEMYKVFSEEEEDASIIYDFHERVFYNGEEIVKEYYRDNYKYITNDVHYRIIQENIEKLGLEEFIKEYGIKPNEK